MKNFFLATVVFLFASNYSLANTDTAECDKITEKLKIGEKIDCLLAVKMKKMNLGTKTKEKLNKIAAIDEEIVFLKSYKDKKKKFDKNNKTLWMMYKNRKNNDK